MITLILLAVWIPVSVLLGVIIGASIRLADEHTVLVRSLPPVPGSGCPALHDEGACQLPAGHTGGHVPAEYAA